MDLNIVVMGGRLAAAPEVRTLHGGAGLVRYLVTTRSEAPRRRIDVVPVVLWDPDDEAMGLKRGDGVWVTGSIQRRFWSDSRQRRSRVEVVAHHVEKREPDESNAAEQEPRSMVEESRRV